MSTFHDLWAQVIREPLLLILSTLAATYTGMIAQKLNAWLGLNNEEKLRDALHHSAENAIGFAAAKAGTTLGGALTSGMTDRLLATAAHYVKSKNPRALRKLKVGDDGLADILLSKIGKGR